MFIHAVYIHKVDDFLMIMRSQESYHDLFTANLRISVDFIHNTTFKCRNLGKIYWKPNKDGNST